jgi:hypothetical protein
MWRERSTSGASSFVDTAVPVVFGSAREESTRVAVTGTTARSMGLRVNSLFPGGRRHGAGEPSVANREI